MNKKFRIAREQAYHSTQPSHAVQRMWMDGHTFNVPSSLLSSYLSQSVSIFPSLRVTCGFSRVILARCDFISAMCGPQNPAPHGHFAICA